MNPRAAARLPDERFDEPLDDLGHVKHEDDGDPTRAPTPPLPKIPPRPLDWPPGEGVDPGAPPRTS